ncbi:hypothetical protein ACET3X_002714 [Alternaria dauci]|uniref:C2H2-type domain-containing protein n=1 Tax=Alternaria dauci TaxID=48095 RepID=A0ABR3UQV6_9PLEO
MYSYADQPTPPFNSPYQQHPSQTGSLLESPYPSPGRQESRPDYTHGLGLYEVQSVQSALPPSPQPSESWGGHYSNDASAEPIVEPYLSGAFDHPVSRSPVPWTSAQPSPPTSPPLYSPPAMSSTAYSPSGPKSSAYSDLKMGPSSWNPSVHIGYGTEAPVTMNGPSSGRHPLTVAPERLSSNMYSYEHTYPDPVMPKYEPASVYNCDARTYERSPPMTSQSSPQGQMTEPTARANTTSLANRKQTRNRRHTDPATAAFHCEFCPKRGFARKYNLRQHMLTHDTNRQRAHVCPHPECGKQFVRRTDLVRHNQSVHTDEKPHVCSKCSAAFPRRDTLTRHNTDGCPNRTQALAEDKLYGRSKL